MTPRETPVPPMREVEFGGAGGALRGRPNPLARDSRLEERGRDRFGEVEGGLSGGMGAEQARVELRRDLGPDRKAAGVQARPDRGAQPLAGDPGLLEADHGVGRDPLACAAPAAVEEDAPREILRHDRDRCAVRRGDGDPRISAADEESIGFAGRRVRLDDAVSVDLMKPHRAIALDTGRGPEPASVFEHRALLIAHPQAEVERRVGAEAYPATPVREGIAGPLGEVARRWFPKRDGFKVRRGRLHPGDIARRAGAAQAICALLLATGCAHGPGPSTGADARARFLESFARPDTATRGAGMLAVRLGGKGREGLNTRWAAVRESLSLVAYAGPIRTIDATILADSVYLAIRPYELGLAGPVPAREGLGPRGLRFLARPWAFGTPWVREAIERAAVEPAGDGWRLAGTLDGADGPHTFALELSARGEPRSLKVQVASGDRSPIAIRYGPVGRFESGRVPRWIEWSRGETQIRLEIEDHAPVKPSQFRHAPPARADWKILALDDPRGRDLLRRLFGAGDGETAR